MNASELVEMLDGEITRLRRVRELLAGIEPTDTEPAGTAEGFREQVDQLRTRRHSPPKKRTMSCRGEGADRGSAAQALGQAK